MPSCAGVAWRPRQSERRSTIPPAALLSLTSRFPKSRPLGRSTRSWPGDASVVTCAEPHPGPGPPVGAGQLVRDRGRRGDGRLGGVAARAGDGWAMGSALVGRVASPKSQRHAGCATCLQARVRRSAVGRVSRLRRFAMWVGERAMRPKSALRGNLGHAGWISKMVSSSTTSVCPHLSTCFQPSWRLSASFVLHTIQVVPLQPFDRGLARKHERA